MTKNRFKWSATTAAFVAASLTGSVALAAQTENECNSSKLDAQQLVFNTDGVAEVNAVMLNGGGNVDANNKSCAVFYTLRDVDFYKFESKGDEDFNIAVLNAYPTMSAILAVFGPNGGLPYYPLGQTWYNQGPIGPGQTFNDPALPKFHAQEKGTYYIGIASQPAYLFTDIDHLYSPTVNYLSPSYGIPGKYTLRIAGAKPPVLQISIDVIPGNPNVTVIDDNGKQQPASLRGRAKGSLPVALLSTEKFDATAVQRDSLRFGKTGKEESLVSCNGGRGTDLNRDGRPDLICHFDLSKAGFDEADTQAYLSGKTGDGMDFEGSGWMKFVNLGAVHGAGPGRK